jgi:hypothetical protein
LPCTWRTAPSRSSSRTPAAPPSNGPQASRWRPRHRRRRRSHRRRGGRAAGRNAAQRVATRRRDTREVSLAGSACPRDSDSLEECGSLQSTTRRGQLRQSGPARGDGAAARAADGATDRRPWRYPRGWSEIAAAAMKAGRASPRST